MQKSSVVGEAAKNDVKVLVLASIISADNDEFGLTEDQKQEIISREQESDNWEYILECMPKEYKNTLVKFFNHEKPNDDKPINNKA